MKYEPGKKVLISGGDGFIGSQLAEKFLLEGYEVRAFSRNVDKKKGYLNMDIKWFDCVLPRKIDISAFSDNLDIFIHCAFETNFKNRDSAFNTNIKGTEKILELCKKNHVGYFVFISSLSAHEHAKSLYGRTKLLIEEMLEPGKDLVIRPGFVIGNGGIFKRLVASIKKSPLLPLFFGGKQKIQTVWIEDLSHGIITAIKKRLVGTIKIAEEDPIKISDYYREICEKLNRKRILIPFPGIIALQVLRILEHLKFDLPMSSENLLGLKSLKVFDVSRDLVKLNFKPISMKESLEKINWVEI
jgi:nucleoside-diphosphate-sugar epimerase